VSCRVSNVHKERLLGSVLVNVLYRVVGNRVGVVIGLWLILRVVVGSDVGVVSSQTVGIKKLPAPWIVP